MSKSFPYLAIPEQHATVSNQKTFDELGIKRVTWNNNVVLNLKKTNFKENQFLFKIRFGTGKALAPASKQGLAYLSERVVQHSGLGSLDTDQLEEALAGKDINFSFDIMFFLHSLSSG